MRTLEQDINHVKERGATNDELLALFKKYYDSKYAGFCDTETAHAISDSLMEALLEHEGYNEAVKFIKSQARWYA